MLVGTKSNVVGGANSSLKTKFLLFIFLSSWAFLVVDRESNPFDQTQPIRHALPSFSLHSKVRKCCCVAEHKRWRWLQGKPFKQLPLPPEPSSLVDLHVPLSSMDLPFLILLLRNVPSLFPGKNHFFFSRNLHFGSAPFVSLYCEVSKWIKFSIFMVSVQASGAVGWCASVFDAVAQCYCLCHVHFSAFSA